MTDLEGVSRLAIAKAIQRLNQTEDNPMPIMHAPTGPVEVSDPNNVPELFVNGPFNIMNMGAMVQITFTTARPDTGEVFAGNSSPKFRGIVASRLLVPVEMARELVRILGQNLTSPGATGGRA